MTETRDARGRWTVTALEREIRYVVDDLEQMVRNDGGPNRKRMPQLSGVPLPGSRADLEVPHAPGQEVDLTDVFEREMRAAGVPVRHVDVDVEMLRPSQDQLVAAKVEGITIFMETAPADSGVFERIFTTRDDYVVDGHHRWAANYVRSRLDGTQINMRCRQLGLERDEALVAATRFMAEWGLPRAGMSNHVTISGFATA